MTFMNSTKSFLGKCKRVWHSLRKPNKQEFQLTAKVSAVGIAILGGIGFLISLFIEIFFFR
jgi:protein transport protein SEC61 subunit gamma-like protein